MPFTKSPATYTTETSTVEIGNASGQNVSRMLLHVTRTAGSFVIGARATGSGLAAINVPYTDRAAPTTPVAAGTPVALTSLIEVDATGVDLLLVLTGFSGSIFKTPLDG